MITIIEDFLKNKNERLRYPESYSSEQIEISEKILEFFKDIRIWSTNKTLRYEEESLKVFLENANTVIIEPMYGHLVRKVYGAVPGAYQYKWSDTSITVQLRKELINKKSLNKLIIRGILKVEP